LAESERTTRQVALFLRSPQSLHRVAASDSWWTVLYLSIYTSGILNPVKCRYSRMLTESKTFSAALCVSLAVVLLVGTDFPVIAQKSPSPPSKEEGKALVDRSNQWTNLRAPGSAAFHLHARVRSHGPKGQTIEGGYELWWASVDRLREEIKWGDKLFVRIADNNLQWIDGSDPYRLDTLRLTKLLDFSSRLRVPSGLSVDRVQTKEIEGVAATCMRLFHISPPNASNPGFGVLIKLPIESERSACWGAATGLPLRIESGSDRLELGAYSTIGDKQFPRKLLEIRDGKPLIEAELDSLELLDVTKTSAFAPPNGKTAIPWCANIILPTPIHLGSASGAAPLPGGGFITPLPTELRGRELVVFRVDEAGRAVDVSTYTMAGEVPFKDRERQTLLESRFKPATCNGRPVETDFLMPEHGL
jgi:hypothetical protein